MVGEARSAPAQVEIIYNRLSGNFDQSALDALAGAFEARGVRAIRREGVPGQALRLAPGTGLLCVFGGDGSAREIVNALWLDSGSGRAGEAVDLCIYPAGTVNLIARERGYERDPQAFVSCVLDRGQAVTAHPLRSSHGPCIACASVGPDSFAVARVSARLKRRIGRLAYVWAMARLLVGWPRHAIEIVADGERLACEAAFLLNARYYAGPWRLAPDAAIDREGAWLLALRRARRRDFLALAVAMLLGRSLERSANVVLRPVRLIEIHSSAPVPVQIDGDHAGTLPIRFEVDRAGIRFA